jgi:hypothetical protein
MVFIFADMDDPPQCVDASPYPVVFTTKIAKKTQTVLAHQASLCELCPDKKTQRRRELRGDPQLP